MDAEGRLISYRESKQPSTSDVIQRSGLSIGGDDTAEPEETAQPPGWRCWKSHAGTSDRKG